MVSALAFKLVVTPILVAVVTLAGRRAGPRVAGWILGLPLSSGPASVFLAIEQGPDFAGEASRGMLAGIAAFAAFCLALARTRRIGWPAALAYGLAAFAVVDGLLYLWQPGFVPAALVGIAGIALCSAAMPRPAASAAPVERPRWDLPLRMVMATAVVIAVTSLASYFGPVGTGLISPIPAFASVIAVFTFRHEGADAAALLLGGIVLGALSFTAFFVVVGLFATRIDVVPLYVLASVAAVATSGIVYLVSHRKRDVATPDEA